MSEKPNAKQKQSNKELIEEISQMIKSMTNDVGDIRRDISEIKDSLSDKEVVEKEPEKDKEVEEPKGWFWS